MQTLVQNGNMTKYKLYIALSLSFLFCFISYLNAQKRRTCNFQVYFPFGLHETIFIDDNTSKNKLIVGLVVNFTSRKISDLKIYFLSFVERKYLNNNIKQATIFYNYNDSVIIPFSMSNQEFSDTKFIKDSNVIKRIIVTKLNSVELLSVDNQKIKFDLQKSNISSKFNSFLSKIIEYMRKPETVPNYSN